MPAALVRPCAEPMCPELVESGRCRVHARQRDQRRGTATARGYTSHWSRVFKPWFIRRLIAAGSAPVCGAALPGGPSLTASRCRAQGLLNDRHLHLHHDPPLRDDERHDRRTVENPIRVGLLCESCHAAETQREQQAGVV